MVTATKTPPRRSTVKRAAPTLPRPAKAPAVAMPLASAPAPTALQARPVPPKVAKAKKQKLVREAFRMPAAEYAVLAALKARAAGLGQPLKKGGLLRAGIQALAVMSDVALKTALQGVPAAAAKD